MLSANCYQPYSRKTEIILRLQSLFSLEEASGIKYWHLWGLPFTLLSWGENAYNLSPQSAKVGNLCWLNLRQQTLELRNLFAYNYFIENKLIKLMKL